MAEYDGDCIYGQREHNDNHCDCHWAHPICWHCDFKVPACDGVTGTALLYIGAIYESGVPYFVLFCSPCHNSRAVHYNLVPDEHVNYYEAYHVLSARYQTEHGVALHPSHVPGTPVAIHFRRISIPEDDFSGFDFEREAQQDVQEDAQLLCDISAIAIEEEGSDPEA
jgi:hypothetical protein